MAGDETLSDSIRSSTMIDTRGTQESPADCSQARNPVDSDQEKSQQTDLLARYCVVGKRAKRHSLKKKLIFRTTWWFLGDGPGGGLATEARYSQTQWESMFYFGYLTAKSVTEAMKQQTRTLNQRNIFTMVLWFARCIHLSGGLARWLLGICKINDELVFSSIWPSDH